MTKGSLALSATAFLVGGCAQPAVTPSATSDQVLAAQYRAQAPHGAMTGEEAAGLEEAYRQGAGRNADAPSSITPMGYRDFPSSSTK